MKTNNLRYSESNWRDIPGRDYCLYAQSFHKAARKLARALDVGPGPIPEYDFCPVLSAWRRAIQVHLKVIVLGEGGNFLAVTPDEISVHKTRSLSWLAQFVTQIITGLKGESSFTADGIEDLAAFKLLVDKANAIDPAFAAFCFLAPSEVPGASRVMVLDFVSRMDARVDLLARTADALAAEWDLRVNPAR